MVLQGKTWLVGIRHMRFQTRYISLGALSAPLWLEDFTKKETPLDDPMRSHLGTYLVALVLASRLQNSSALPAGATTTQNNSPFYLSPGGFQ